MKRAILLFSLLTVTLGAAQIPEKDARLTVLTSRHHYKMPEFTSRAAWLERAAFLRKQILSSAGLLPLPEKTPLNAQVFGKLEREGYTIEKVLLETLPGFYLGGNLYRPRGQQGPFPGVVSPHGHWQYGRLEHSEQVSVPGRCINLARQGFVVFSYDMIGYSDTNQIPHDWGGPREDLWSIGPMGIQLWDSIRAVDFITSLADVDPNRIAVTGASGGGTQTFLLTAVEDRIKAAAPVNMISAQQSGGTCENGPNMRAGADDISNMMIGALAAPRPLLMVSAAGDWTRNTPTEEYPAIRSIYRLFDAERNVESVQFNFLHNYNRSSREAVYTFFNARMLDKKGPIPEQSFRVEFLGDMLALFGRERPANAVDLDRLIENWIRDAQHSTDSLWPRDAASLAAARAAFAERLTFTLLAVPPKPGTILSETKGETLVLGRLGKGDRVPAVWLTPSNPNPRISPTLVVHPAGTSGAKNSALVRTILDRGGVVMSIDAFETGPAKTPRNTSARLFDNFNSTDDANRVQDILTALEYLRERTKARTVNLVGLETAGVWTYFARALAGDQVTLAADLGQFAAATDQAYIDKFFIPGLRKAGDFRAAAVMNSRGRALLYNAAPEFPTDWMRAAADAAGTSVDVRNSPVSEAELAAWIAPEPPPRNSRR
jgi:dienelactone hydrolase